MLFQPDKLLYGTHCAMNWPVCTNAAKSKQSDIVCDVFRCFTNEIVLKCFPFRQPFDSSHRYSSSLKLEEDSTNHIHMYDVHTALIQDRLHHILFSLYTFTDAIIHWVTSSSARPLHRRKCAHTNAFGMIFSVFFLYVVLCCLHVEWIFDSGEFVLKLNASLNNSLVQVPSVSRLILQNAFSTWNKKKVRSGKKMCVVLLLSLIFNIVGLNSLIHKFVDHSIVFKNFNFIKVNQFSRLLKIF